MNSYDDETGKARPGTGMAGDLVKAAIGGALAALLLGLGMGWLRYWMGFFVLAQGAVCGLLIAWLVRRITRAAISPENAVCLKLALLWFLIFQAGLAVGFGLAQPWFAPLGFLAQVLSGDGIEFAFGVMSSGGVQKGFAMGAGGFMWVVFSLVDWAVMYFFLARLPWGAGADPVERATTEPPARDADDQSPRPRKWMNLVGVMVALGLALGLLVDFYTVDPALDLKVAQAALRAGDCHQALRLARRAAYFGGGSPGGGPLARTVAAQAAWRLAKPDWALAELNEVLAVDPGFCPALLLRGEILASRSDSERAMADLDRYIESAAAPHKAPVPVLSLAYEQRAAGREGPGLDQLARRIPEADKDLALAMALRGRARLAKGELGPAREDLQAALALNDKDPDHHYQLSLVLEKLGLMEAARRECWAALWFAKRLEKWAFEADIYYKRDWVERLMTLERKAEGRGRRSGGGDERHRAAPEVDRLLKLGQPGAGGQ